MKITDPEIISITDKIQTLGDKKLITFIKNEVASYFDMNTQVYYEKTRKREIITIRQIATYFLKKYVPRLSFAQVGAFMGGKDHATIMYTIRKCQDLYETDKAIRSAMDNIERSIKEESEKLRMLEENVNSMISFNNVTIISIDDHRNIATTGLTKSEVRFIADMFPSSRVKQCFDTGMYLLHSEEKNQDNL